MRPLAIGIMTVVLLAACGKKGDPLPPPGYESSERPGSVFQPSKNSNPPSDIQLETE